MTGQAAGWRILQGIIDYLSNMDRSLDEWIKGQPPERQAILRTIHGIVVAGDATVQPVVKPMMGKQMIVYEANGTMKYALSSVGQHMTLHVLPIYGAPALSEKYRKLLPAARFGKGCINFQGSADLPPDVVKRLVADCAPIDLARMLQGYREKKRR